MHERPFRWRQQMRARSIDAIDFRQIQIFLASLEISPCDHRDRHDLGVLVLLTLTPRYTATAQVLLEPRKEKIFGAKPLCPNSA